MLLPELKPRTVHGGEHSIGKRKTARPIATKRPMHLVMRAAQARGAWSLLHPKNAPQVKRLLQLNSKKWHVTVYEWANVGNHLHLLVRAKTREGLQHFLRAFAGALAMAVTGAGKSKPLRERFWSLLAFSRLINWGKDYGGVRRYVLQNANGERHAPLPERKGLPTLTAQRGGS